MLKRNRLKYLMLIPVFMTPNTLTPFHNQAMQITGKQIDNIEMVHKDNLGLVKPPIFVRFDKDKEELMKKKSEDIKAKEVKDNEKQWQEYILTFYTSLDSENGYGAITSQGKKLSRGGVANNIIPQNTKIYLDKWGEVIVNDKGSNKHFSVDYRLDVFVEREPNESDRQYARRVNSYGVQKVKGYIIK